MPFVKGQSGNPAGRPPKARALTSLLEEIGNQPVETDGVPANRFVAAAMWQLATTGKTTLVGGKRLALDEKLWFELVGKIYSQIDGPPRQDLGIEGELKQFVLGLTPEQFEKL